jgi:5-methylcytosine-specific restriction endonuclease McrA
MSKRTTTPKKKVISKKLREEVWLKHFGKIFSSKCPIEWCTRVISVFSFEVGHNIPESKGGRTTIDNLIPICGDCNRSMGDRFTIDEFSKQFASAVSTTVPKTLFQRIFGCFNNPQPQAIQPRKKIKLERNRSFVRTIYK